MKLKISLWLILTVGLILWDYYKNRNISKTFTATGTFVWISALATIGMSMRAILPLFAVHYILVLISWVGLLYYIWRGKYYWWIFMLPALTVLTFIGLNFLEGSRYEK